jgi:hypothetical protein
MVEQKSLLVGKSAWRLNSAIVRRPERADADEHGGSGCRTTICSDNKLGAGADELLDATSILPRCKFATKQS